MDRAHRPIQTKSLGSRLGEVVRQLGRPSFLRTVRHADNSRAEEGGSHEWQERIRRSGRNLLVMFAL